MEFNVTVRFRLEATNSITAYLAIQGIFATLWLPDVIKAIDIGTPEPIQQIEDKDK